jgi:hypothetical protein
MDQRSEPSSSGSGFFPTIAAAEVVMTSSTTGTGSGKVATDETEHLISSSKVEGTAVYDRQGERQGTVSSFKVNKFTGQVAYAVMSFGGFLGMGRSCHPCPGRR